MSLQVDIFRHLLSSRFTVGHLGTDGLLQPVGEELGLLHAYARLHVLREHVVQVVVFQVIIEDANFIRVQNRTLLQLRHKVLAYLLRHSTLNSFEHIVVASINSSIFGALTGVVHDLIDVFLDWHMILILLHEGLFTGINVLLLSGNHGRPPDKCLLWLAVFKRVVLNHRLLSLDARQGGLFDFLLGQRLFLVPIMMMVVF